MLTLTIPCETYHRLATIAQTMYVEANDWHRSLRIDNGVAVVSNRSVMAVERIGGPDGVAHITVDPALIAQCKVEAAFNNDLTVAVNPMLNWASATTTLGYQFPGNALVTCAGENRLADWRSIIPSAPSTRYKGPMFWNAHAVAELAKSSPSGRLVFEEKPDIDKPIIVRDAYDDSWFGTFIARGYPGDTMPCGAAVVPQWLKDACK